MRLLAWSRENSNAAQEYCEFVKNYAIIDSFIAAQIESRYGYSEDAQFDQALWNALQEDQDTAPKLVIPVEKPSRQLVQKVVYPSKDKQKVSRLSVFFLLMNAAAMLFFIIFARFVPPKSGIPVATVQDSINAGWADTSLSVRNGTRLKTGSELLLLREGLVKLVFDNATTVVLEGPAEFQILTNDHVKLNYGRIYAIVPPQAYGFQITTPDAKIIDLGTEFGVQQDMYGNTELHVISGKTSLVSGARGNRINVYVEGGGAKRLDASIGQIKEIACDRELFARHIDSQRNLVWRGQNTLDLADIAGMGNGLGSGKTSVVIHPRKGYTKDREYGFIRPRGFLPIAENPYVDGVFVPNNEDPELTISTHGDIFKDVPQTSGVFSIDLVVNPAPGFFAGNSRSGTIVFDGQRYGHGGKPCISMHANIGLTFDLDAIRKSYRRNIRHFTSQIGIADLNEPTPCNADFWVLVDGQVRYSLRQYKEKGVLNDVTVEIRETDRFLTLITTDGGDPDNLDQGKPANMSDWCVFVEPVLMLESQ